MNDYIPKEELKIGIAYAVHARNFTTAIWDGARFHGVRIKFGDSFISEEYHYDDGAPYGTVKPLKELT